ncbi:MAG: hypothetical protein ACOYMA_17530 [Bacteroidia bacterium]
MNAFNQVITQKEFGNYSSSTWAIDCLSCNDREHADDETTSEDCQLCIAYSPIIKTYNYLDFIVLTMPIIIIIIIIGFFRRKTR